MDFELRRAREKLEKEQKERKAQAKARLERERKAKGEARKQREAIEAVQRSRRLDALEAQEKTLILSFEDKGLGAGTYSVGVYGFKGTSKFVVSVIINDNIQRTVGQQAGSSSSPAEMDTVECRNCKRFIPSRTVALHEAYCSRHNVVCQHVGCGIVLRVEEAKNHVHCDKCGQAFQQVEMEKHMKVFHEPIQCPCGVILEKVQMVEHQASVCPLRLIACRFCGDMVHAGDTAVDLRDKMQGRLHPDHW